MARPDKARLGAVRCVMAWQSRFGASLRGIVCPVAAAQGSARQSWQGLTRCGWAWCGWVRFGSHGGLRRGIAGLGTARLGEAVSAGLRMSHLGKACPGEARPVLSRHGSLGSVRRVLAASCQGVAVMATPGWSRQGQVRQCGARRRSARQRQAGLFRKAEIPIASRFHG